MALAAVEGKKLVSFASKYAHFYCDQDLPLTDWYAIFALTRHLGERQARIEDWTRDYPTYCAKLELLKTQSGVTPTSRELDHYLWLAGNWVWWKKKGAKAKINRELEAFFSQPPGSVQAEAAFGPLQQ